MNSIVRFTSFIMVAFVALACAACKSKNEGIIVGKWKLVDGGTMISDLPAAKLKELQSQNVYLVVDFRANNAASFGVDTSDPQMQQQLAKVEKTKLDFKYRLRSGETVEFYDLPREVQEKTGRGSLFGNRDRARTRVTIGGDNMSWTDPDGKTCKFVRMN